MSNQNTPKLTEHGVEIEDCFDNCPHVMDFDYLRCHHSSIGPSRFISEFDDYEGFPEWCPLSDATGGDAS